MAYRVELSAMSGIVRAATI